MRIYTALLFTLALMICSRAAFPQQGLTKEEIISGLSGSQPPSVGTSLTRESIISALGGDSTAETSEAGKKLFKGLQNRKTRFFRIKEREEVESFTASQPIKISVEVYFDYNSDEITPSAKSTLDVLGSALQDPRMAGKLFIFRGHTDAKGNADYNLKLSDRRAESAKKYIVRAFGVDERTLTTIGNGSRTLKNQNNPFADENRRVEVVRSD